MSKAYEPSSLLLLLHTPIPAAIKAHLTKRALGTQIQIVKRVVIICTERSKIEDVRMVVTVVWLHL
jgi:hypothetical protein